MKKVKIKLNSEMSVLEIANTIEHALKDLRIVIVDVTTEGWLESGVCMKDKPRMREKSTIVITDFIN